MTADFTRDEWLSLRKRSIGASEAAAACGEDPSVSPIELVCKKRGELPDVDLSDIEAVQWGNILEPAIVRESARRAGVLLLDRQAIESAFADDAQTELVGFVDGAHPFLRSRARPWQTATLDGLAYAPWQGLVSIEAKNTGQFQASLWDGEDAPDKFRLQVAHQLAVVPAVSSGILSGLVGGNSLRSVRLERVRIVQVIEAVIAIEESVWRCVESGTMPELSGPPASVARALAALHPEDDGASVMLDAGAALAARELEIVKAQRKESKARVEELQNILRAAIGNATFGVMPDGSGAYSLKTEEREEHIVSASKFRKLLFKQSKATKRKS